MSYRVTLKIDGQWQAVVRGFEAFDGASRWAADVLAASGAGELRITGYQVLDQTNRVVCSVEHGMAEPEATP